MRTLDLPEKALLLTYLCEFGLPQWADSLEKILAALCDVPLSKAEKAYQAAVSFGWLSDESQVDAEEKSDGLGKADAAVRCVQPRKRQV